MASGHANRANRPNTWLHRPHLRREDSPCQLGAVHTWHIPDPANWREEFRLRAYSRSPNPLPARPLGATNGHSAQVNRPAAPPIACQLRENPSLKNCGRQLRGGLALRSYATMGQCPVRNWVTTGRKSRPKTK